METGSVTKKPGWASLLRIAWQEGGRIERVLVAYIVCSPLLGISALALLASLSGVRGQQALMLWVGAVVPLVMFPVFQGPIYDSAYGLAFMRRTLSQGWMTPQDREYYSELLRFRETFGRNGRLKGDLFWAFGYCLAYLGSVVVAGFAGATLFEHWGEAAIIGLIAIEWFGGIVAGAVYSARTRAQFAAAEARGFRLLELKRQTRHRRPFGNG